MNNSYGNDMKYIVEFVKKYRVEHNIQPGFDSLQEISGRYAVKVICCYIGSLVNTHEGYGSWHELEDPDVRQLVVNEIRQVLDQG